MHIDKTTLDDISIFGTTGGLDVFSLIDRTMTQAGKAVLRQHVLNPPDNIEKLLQVQDTVKFWQKNTDLFPKCILNGTLVMLEKYFESADHVSFPKDNFSLILNLFYRKVLNHRENSFIRFSLSHLVDLFTGCKQLVKLLSKPDLPILLKVELEFICKEIENQLIEDLLGINEQTSYKQLALLDYKVKRELKYAVKKIILVYAKLDAWHSLALASIEHGWQFPTIQDSLPVCFETVGLRHPLLLQPISYNVCINHQNNFLLLTGANMSGKTTFLRSIGVGALLAHLGCGVPADFFKISFLSGIVTNMHVVDNIFEGDSYFFAEVKRMKQTATKLSQSQPHLALMDELFKGTNVHDACECTKAMIEGLLNQSGHLMILSTHLYEVAKHFCNRNNIQFSYFITDIDEQGDYHFTYQMKRGISDDKIGYKILMKEGIMDLLK